MAKDQTMGIGQGRYAKLDNSNARILDDWYWPIGQSDYSHSNMDVDFYVGLLGAESDEPKCKNRFILWCGFNQI